MKREEKKKKKNRIIIYDTSRGQINNILTFSLVLPLDGGLYRFLVRVWFLRGNLV